MATFIVPNYGHYSGATYTFTDDPIFSSTPPTGWVFDTPGNQTDVWVAPEWQGHLNVLKFRDENTASAAYTKIYQAFTAGGQTSGTVEFWVGSDDTTNEALLIRLEESAGSEEISLFLTGDQFKYYDSGVGYVNLQAVADDTWYRVRIDFDCVGEYAAPLPYVGTMGADIYNVYIYDEDNVLLNSIEDEPFDGTCDTITRFRIDTTGGKTIYAWMDAIGYSWDTSYTVGDNATKDADVDLSDDTIDFKITTEIGKVQKATARIKDYTTQVDDVIRVTETYTSEQNTRGFYKDSMDFSDDTIGSAPAQTGEGTWADNTSTNNTSAIIIDKFNKHRNVLQLYDNDKWLYDATYNFEGETGETGTDITYVDAATLYNGAAEIVATWQSHNEVLRLLDDATAGEDPFVDHTTTQATSGIIEFYLGTNDITEFWQYNMWEDADVFVTIRIYNSNLEYNDNSGTNIIKAAANDTWYHFKIEWYADDTFDLYVDEVLEKEGGVFKNSQTSGVNLLRLKGYGDSTDYIYLDAFGQVGVSSYAEGDNLIDAGRSSISLALTDDTVEDGSIEFWVATTDPTYEFVFEGYDESGNLSVGLQIDADGWQFWDDNNAWQTFVDDTAPLIGKWYRCTITFDCDGDTLSYTIVDEDDTAIASCSGKTMYGTPTYIEDLYFKTQGTDIGYIVFIDAIGFTWDTGYTLGDNANYEDSTLTAQTIFEGQITKQTRTAIQKFNIITETEELNQPVGEESTEVILEADYSPNMINDMMDEYNHTTATDQSEKRRGTFTFKDDTDTAIPMGFVCDDVISVVAASVGSHKYTVKFQDERADTSYSMKGFFEEQIYGTVEFWYYCNDPTDGFFVQLRHGTTAVAGVGVDEDEWQYWKNDSTWANCTTITTGPTAQTWYRVKLDFECTADIYTGLAQYDYSITVYTAANVIVDGVEDDIDMDSNEVHIDNINFFTSTADKDHNVYIDSIGYSWDWNYPICKDYTVGDNDQILIYNIEPSVIGAKAADTIILAGDVSGRKIIKDFADKELMIWYLNPSNEILMNDGTNDSQIDFSSSDKIWAVKGEDRIQVINKVVVKGGMDTVPKRVYATANNTSSQVTYGVKLMTVYVTELLDDTDDLQAIADNILAEHENAPDQVTLWRDCSTEGMLQVGETITISADDIRYSGNTDYITAGQWIIKKIEYQPLDQIAKIWLINSLLYTPDEIELEFIERLVNQSLA